MDAVDPFIRESDGDCFSHVVAFLINEKMV